MRQPCMSCGEDRRLPAPHRCKHQANHHPAPCLTERERMLDLLEAALKFGTDHDLASYKAQGETIVRIEALLAEHGRLPKEER